MAVSKYNPEGYFDHTPHEALTKMCIRDRSLTNDVLWPDRIANEKIVKRFCF